MNIEKLKHEILEHEGFRDVVYRDHLGNPTVGIGHLIKNNEPWRVGDKLDLNTIDKLFEYDVNIAMKDAEEYIGIKVPDECLMILTNMAFQLGRNRLAGFKKVKQAILESKWDVAADEMLDSAWRKQTPRRCEELAERMRNVG